MLVKETRQCLLGAIRKLENENVHGTYTKISWKKERSELRAERTMIIR